MSINVTVNGNPVNIRKGRMVLSDLDQIKKNERDRRRRLRLEQVRQQSKEISNRLLERARNLTQKELSRLEKDGKSELKQMHDRKIMDIQQKYQEDMEDIGQAHLAATLQPDVNAIIEAEARRNRVLALERGKEAAQKLKEAEMREDARLLQQERMRKVREAENVRAATVVGKSKSSNKKEEILVSDSSRSDNAIIEVVNDKHSKRTKVTKSPSKKAPIKVVTKSNVKVVANDSKFKSQAGSSKTLRKSKEREEKEKKEKKEENKQPVSRDKLNRSKTRDDNYSSNISRLTTTPNSDIDEVDERSVDYEYIPSTKSSKPSRYNPRDYIHESIDSSSSSGSSSSSSSISEDSSYFSDAADPPVIKRTQKIQKTPVKSKVQLYDHNTRQKNVYDRPTGIVERIDVTNEPNAEDLARKVVELERANADLLKKRQTTADRRGQEALLREKIRRDYEELMRNLEHLSREERKLKASQIHEPSNLHMSPTRRKEVQKRRQRKMNRAVEGILRASEDSPYTLTEKIVTLKPQEDPDDIYQIHPDTSWQEPPFREPSPLRFSERKDSFDQLSQEELILELLQKVERQKRILLREIGTHMPDMFGSSGKGADSKPEFSRSRTPVQRPPSPEIQVINVSKQEEVRKPIAQEKAKATQHTEIAVQTSTIESDTVEDKGVQVELSYDQSQRTENNDFSEGVSRINGEPDNENRRIHPLEPVVRILTPEVADSSSGSSIITDLLINFDKKQVQVTPKRKKKGTLKISRKTSPMISSKSRSSPGSKNTTPVKKSSKSAPPSRIPTPKKSHDPRVLEGRQGFHINRGFRAEIDNMGGVTVDSSTESSQIYSTPENGSSGKVFRIRTQSSKKTIRIRDTTDTTTTSYNSPPNTKNSKLLNQGALKDITPILEMLDSRANNVPHVQESQISPVSTPETPSPRTIKLATNIPNPEKISRMLKFVDIEKEVERRRKNQPSTSDQRQMDVQKVKPSTSRSPKNYKEKCACSNPNCKMHEDLDLDEIDSQTLRNYPKMKKAYENLESDIVKRIASLTDFIKRIRNNENIPAVSDFTLASPQDSSSFLQFSSGSIPPRDLRDVVLVMDNVEEINNQLARTLQESRRIIAGEGIDLPKSPVAFSQIQKSPELSDSKSKESISSEELVEEPIDRMKPKILSDEPVQLNLDKYRLFQGASKLEQKNRPSVDVFQPEHEDIVERLSNEILEQSKSVDKSSGLVTLESLKETDSYLAMKEEEFDLQDFDSSEEQNGANLSDRKNSETPKKKEDFGPVLAGIPKTPRVLPSSNSRGRPPVTLISGPYRQNLDSPAHELSTIVEFDTPDTANRSQTSVKTSPSKAKRNLVSDIASTLVSPKKPTFKKPLGQSKNSTNTKPSVHVAPLPSQRTPECTPKRPQIQTTATQLFSSDSLIPRRKSPKKFDAFAFLKESKSNSSESSEQDVQKNGELPLDTIHKDENEKLTTDIFQPDGPLKKVSSTSSNSFSSLSGISEIVSTPSSDFLKGASSPEEMERTLKKFGLGWAITTLKKTREASALSSSSNSDVTPIMTARKIISPIKRQVENLYLYGLPDFSDVSSISIKEASKSTERAVLLKGRTSTPNIVVNSNSDKSGSTTTNSSCVSLREPNDSLIAPNLFLSHGKKNSTKQTKHL